MTSNVKVETNPTISGEPLLVLRDVQSLLRESIGEDVIVIDYAVDRLIPQGENFAGTILKVNAAIKRAKNSAVEKLALAAKMIPSSDFQREQFNCTGSFRKEIFVFEKLLPAYRQLEKDAGQTESELFDILPKYYGGRLSLSKEIPDVADENAVILMENLKERGYHTMDKMTGLDYGHAKFAISKLAHFHALGIALKIEKPDIFEEAKEPLSELPFNVNVDEMSQVIDHITQLICEDSRIAQYESRIKTAIQAASRGMEFFLKPKNVESWVSIAHGDFWVNNIMFREDNGELDDVKFLDFQMAQICSPLTDLPYFLFGSCRSDVIEEHLDDLLDVYHSKLLEFLQKNGCDTSPFERKHFDEQLKKDAWSRLFQCFFALKFYTFEADEGVNLDEVNLLTSLLLSGANSQFFERSWRCISKYVEKGWI